MPTIHPFFYKPRHIIFLLRIITLKPILIIKSVLLALVVIFVNQPVNAAVSKASICAFKCSNTCSRLGSYTLKIFIGYALFCKEVVINAYDTAFASCTRSVQAMPRYDVDSSDQPFIGYGVNLQEYDAVYARINARKQRETELSTLESILNK